MITVTHSSSTLLLRPSSGPRETRGGIAEPVRRSTVTPVSTGNLHTNERAHTSANTHLTLESVALLQGRTHVAIVHNGEMYQLRATRMGKLILTK